MRKYALYIIGCVLLVGLVAGIFRSMLDDTEQLRGDVKRLRAQASAYHEQARSVSCTVIGRDTARCYEGDREACKLKASEIAEYKAEYNADPDEDCSAASTSDPAPIATRNPLLFDDEIGR